MATGQYLQCDKCYTTRLNLTWYILALPHSNVLLSKIFPRPRVDTAYVCITLVAGYIVNTYVRAWHLFDSATRLVRHDWLQMLREHLSASTCTHNTRIHSISRNKYTIRCSMHIHILVLYWICKHVDWNKLKIPAPVISANTCQRLIGSTTTSGVYCQGSSRQSIWLIPHCSGTWEVSKLCTAPVTKGVHTTVGEHCMDSPRKLLAKRTIHQ